MAHEANRGMWISIIGGVAAGIGGASSMIAPGAKLVALALSVTAPAMGVGALAAGCVLIVAGTIVGIIALAVSSVKLAKKYRKVKVSWENFARMFCHVADTADQIEGLVEELKHKVEDCSERVTSAELVKRQFLQRPTALGSLKRSVDKVKLNFERLKVKAHEAMETTVSCLDKLKDLNSK